MKRPPTDALAASAMSDGIVLYDGVCVLCSAWFRFVAKRDPEARFRFAAIQSRFGRDLARRLGIDPYDPHTNAVVIGGRSYIRSDAALQLLRSLPGWSWSSVFFAVPRPLRDWLYDRIARNRYRWFGRTETCMVVSEELRRHTIADIAGTEPVG